MQTFANWATGRIVKPLSAALADLQVEINEEKSRTVDHGRGESCG
jgi:hypothetical protein